MHVEPDSTVPAGHAAEADDDTTSGTARLSTAMRRQRALRISRLLFQRIDPHTWRGERQFCTHHTFFAVTHPPAPAANGLITGTGAADSPPNDTRPICARDAGAPSPVQVGSSGLSERCGGGAPWLRPRTWSGPAASRRC